MIIHQLHFNKESRANCFREQLVKKIKVGETVYFENKEIVKGCPYSPEEINFFGVWSHKAQTKIRAAGNRNFSLTTLYKKVCNDYPTDVIGFHHSIKNMLIFTGERREILDRCFSHICRELKLKVAPRGAIRFAVMQNHFLARPHVFNRYVEEALRPAMDLIESNAIPEIWQGCEYTQAAPGVKYTFIPFVLEKLFSAWLQNNPAIKCTYFKDL